MPLASKYGKPNMTGLPKDLGKHIFETIRSTPAPDFKRMHQESVELEMQMKKEREKHRNDD